MGRKASKGARTKTERDLPKLMSAAESFGEFASMCFAGRVK
jgi:murein endopeptidase